MIPRELFLSVFAFQSMLAMTASERDFWDKTAERWGIAFFSLVILFFLARWTAKREDSVRKERDRREDAINKERLALLQRNNELQEQQLEASRKHAAELKQIIKDGNKHSADVGVELKNLARRVRCPGAPPPQES